MRPRGAQGKRGLTEPGPPVSSPGDSLSRSGSRPVKRRAFLGAAAAAGTTAAFVAALRESLEITFDHGPGWPLQTRQLTLFRGALEESTEAHLTLRLYGPNGETFTFRDERLALVSPLVSLDVQLAYAHPRLVPGTWRYVARVEAAGQLAEAALAYELHPFVFGV